MPMYEWKCKKCEKITNTIVPVAQYQVPPEKCDTAECDGLEFEKVIGGGNFILMGYGWSRDNYS